MVPAIAVSIGLIWFEKKRAIWIIGLSLVVVALSNPLSVRVLKPFFGRFRPCHPEFFIEGGRFLLGYEHSYAFPSAHATNVFAQAAYFSLVYRKCTPWFFVFAALIGYSRIYVGVHYPLDVLFGMVCGCAVGGAVYGVFFLIRNLYRKKRGTMWPHPDTLPVDDASIQE